MPTSDCANKTYSFNHKFRIILTIAVIVPLIVIVSANGGDGGEGAKVNGAGVLNSSEQDYDEASLSEIIKLAKEQFQLVPALLKVIENETVVMPCDPKRPFELVKWFRNNRPLIDSKQRDQIDVMRTRSRLWDNGSLQLIDATRDDVGEYICVLLIENGYIYNGYQLEVQYPAQATSSPSGYIEVEIGSQFDIVCNVTGVPQPIVEWRRNGQNIRQQINEKQYSVVVASREDAGIIECVAANGFSESSIAQTEMIVLFTPEVTQTAHVVYTKIGMRAMIECQVQSAPIATVHWFRNGKPLLITSDRGQITRSDIETTQNTSVDQYFYTKTHRLHIKHVRDTDLGQYECRAENKIGFHSVYIELTGRPRMSTFKTPLSAARGLTQTIIWQTESYSPITEYKLKFRQLSSGNLTPDKYSTHEIEWTDITIPGDNTDGQFHSIGYTLQGLLPASVYETEVLSRNRYGWSDVSKRLQFATSGEVKSTASFTTETSTGDYQEEDNLITDLSSPSFYEYKDLISSAKPTHRFLQHAHTTIMLICLTLLTYSASCRPTMN